MVDEQITRLFGWLAQIMVILVFIMILVGSLFGVLYSKTLDQVLASCAILIFSIIILLTGIRREGKYFGDIFDENKEHIKEAN